MIISLSDSSHIAFGRLSLNFNWTSEESNLYGEAYRYTVTKAQSLGNSTFAEVNFSFPKEVGIPITRFTFSEGARSLGISCSPKTIIPKFEDLMLQRAYILDSDSKRFKLYKPGLGLRSFSYSGDFVLIYGEECSVPVDGMKDLVGKMLFESDANSGMSILNEMLRTVDKLIIVSAAYERCYMVSRNMNNAVRWLSDVCNDCKIEFNRTNPEDFPT